MYILIGCEYCQNGKDWRSVFNKINVSPNAQKNGLSDYNNYITFTIDFVIEHCVIMPRCVVQRRQG